MKRLITFVTVLLPLTLLAVDVQTARTRADRFFGENEWASATAYYGLVIEEERSDTVFGRALVSAMMTPDTLSLMQFTDKAIAAQIPFVDLFTAVKMTCFSIGSTDSYERYLLFVKQKYAWMARAVDSYLLDYYIFRNDGENMVLYSQAMLVGLPDSEKFLASLAEGYSLTDRMSEAIATYHRILNINPDNYDALLYVGNYLISIGERKEAMNYLQRAYSLRPTPYLKKIIETP